MKFYAVNLQPFKNGRSRWAVYELIAGSDPELVKLWPKDPRNHAQAKKNGWSYSENRNFPAYSFYINEIGSDHIHLLKEQICLVLENERDLRIDPNKLDLKVLG